MAMSGPFRGCVVQLCLSCMLLPANASRNALLCSLLTSLKSAHTVAQDANLLALSSFQLPFRLNPTGPLEGLTRIHNQLNAPLRVEHGQLGEAYVIADGDSKAAGIGVDHGACLARAQRVGLLERDAVWNVYVEEVHLYAGRAWAVRMTPRGAAATDRRLVCVSKICQGQQLIVKSGAASNVVRTKRQEDMTFLERCCQRKF